MFPFRQVSKSLAHQDHMEIIDSHSLIPDHEVLKDVVETHPLCSCLYRKILSVTIELAERCGIPNESISFDPTNSCVTLNVGRDTPAKSNYKYILYHEFSHAADRLNSSFGYSEKKKATLTGDQQTCAMELWNVYIDARLNQNNLYQIGHQSDALATINGRLQRPPKGLQGELMLHIATLERCGFEHDKAEDIVSRIWNYPQSKMSYDDMIRIVVMNIG